MGRSGPIVVRRISGHPQQRMDPERRLIERLDDERAADHHEAGENDDEHRRPVAGIDEGVVEPADLAARRAA